MSFEVGNDRPFCKECRKHRPWDKLPTQHETHGQDKVVVFFCDRCGNQIYELNLSDRAIAKEISDREERTRRHAVDRVAGVAYDEGTKRGRRPQTPGKGNK